jgi:hypothetical protein
LILRVENKDDATARQLPVADVDYREGDYRLVQYRRQP